DFGNTNEIIFSQSGSRERLRQIVGKLLNAQLGMRADRPIAGTLLCGTTSCWLRPSSTIPRCLGKFGLARLALARERQRRLDGLGVRCGATARIHSGITESPATPAPLAANSGPGLRVGAGSYDARQHDKLRCRGPLK